MTDNPFNYGNPVSGKQFIGRREQVEEVAHDLSNPRGHSHALIGGRRFGKSSFLEALQETLIKQLVQAEPGDLYILPVLISLKSLDEHSLGGVFALMLHTLYDYFHSSLLREPLGLTLDFDISQTQLAVFKNNNQQVCPFRVFSNIIEELLNYVIKTYGLLHIVFLLDETEEIIDQQWTEDIFSNLRSLIYTGKLRAYLRCVFAGSSKLIAVREKGSPLLNMLKIVYMEALGDEHIREIANNNFDAETVERVIEQSGGHPYLAQYIMHYAWESRQKGIAPSIPDIVNKFRSGQHHDLTQWCNDIGESGLIAYKILLEANTWLTEREVKQRVNTEQIVPAIGPALFNLCYHGLIVHDGSWSRYHVKGNLFQDWFTDNILPSPQLPVPAAPNNPPVISLDQHDIDVSLYSNIFPTAYCYAIGKDQFPFIKVTINNTHPYYRNMKIIIEAIIQEFSYTDADTLNVASGQSEQTILLPQLTPSAILKLNEIFLASCKVTVKWQTESNLLELYRKTDPVYLQARDTALLALLDEHDKLKEDLTDYLAVFVTPRHAKIHELIGIAAAEYHPDKAIAGYQGAIIMVNGKPTIDLIAAREISRKNAHAFFDTLKDHSKLHYTNSTNNLGQQLGYFTQRVRLPFESLALPIGQSNCIDGSVVFASLLENADMEPLIALVEGHAFVGWRIWEGVDQYDFLETTMIRDFNFQQALDEGNRQYNEALQRNDHTRAYLDANGFIRLVDIVDCRSKRINPLVL